LFRAAVFKPGVCMPLGVGEKFALGKQNFKNLSKDAYLGRIFDIGGVHKGDPILIWGYAEEYNFDLGVRQ
jgi:hypothetical protein